MGTYKLFQVKPEQIRDYGFVSLDHAQKAAGSDMLPREVWQEVYSFERDPHELAYTIGAQQDLEEVYRIFNEERPEDFKGHSMSVSDIVEAPYGLWYCDSIGFRKVEWRDSDR